MSDGVVSRRIEWITNLSVIVTLINLVVEVRGNTRALERQVVLDEASQLTTPFLSGPELLEAYEHVKSVDGSEPVITAFTSRYGMKPTQAVAWTRSLHLIWQGLEADYVYGGETPELTARIQALLSFPDDQLFWKPSDVPQWFAPDFVAYVERLRTAETASASR